MQDSGDQEKSRNFVSHSRYRSILWLYFDDIESVNPPYSFSPSQAHQIIETVVVVETQSPKTTIAVHCVAGVSRSQAIAHFIATHFGTPSQVAEIENRDPIVYRSPTCDTNEQTLYLHTPFCGY